MKIFSLCKKLISFFGRGYSISDTEEREIMEAVKLFLPIMGILRLYMYWAVLCCFLLYPLMFTFLSTDMVQGFVSDESAYIAFVARGANPRYHVVHTFVRAYVTIPLGILMGLNFVRYFMVKDSETGERRSLVMLRQWRKIKQIRTSYVIFYVFLPVMLWQFTHEHDASGYYAGGCIGRDPCYIDPVGTVIAISATEMALAMTICFILSQSLRVFKEGRL